MKRLLLTTLILAAFLLINLPHTLVRGETRYGVCDLCGYCPLNQPTPPSTWANCVACIYPSVSPIPSLKQSLLIDPYANSGPTPFPGHQYTVLGCIKTDLRSFRQEGAASSVVQVLLNIVFSVVGGVGLLAIIYGSFLILTSQGNIEQLNYGKRVVFGAIVGIIFSVSSVFIINLLASGVLKLPGFGQ